MTQPTIPTGPDAFRVASRLISEGRISRARAVEIFTARGCSPIDIRYGLPPETLADIFDEEEARRVAEVAAEDAREAARWAALSPEEQAAEIAAREAKLAAWADAVEAAEGEEPEEDEDEDEDDDREFI